MCQERPFLTEKMHETRLARVKVLVKSLKSYGGSVIFFLQPIQCSTAVITVSSNSTTMSSTKDPIHLRLISKT